MTGHRASRLIMRSKSISIQSRIPVAIAVGIFLGCLFAFMFPYNFHLPTKPQFHTSKAISQVKPAKCQLSEQWYQLRAEFMAAMEKEVQLMKKVSELTEKLRLVELEKDQARKQVMLLGKHQKFAPFGTLKGSKLNLTVTPDESVNPRLAKILDKVAIQRELIVTLAKWNVMEELEVWFHSIQTVGITNYLVIALDDEIFKFCESSNVPVYKPDPDKTFDSVGGSYAVSGLKFHVLRDFLLSGYSVLLSDTDVVYLQNPFDHLYRDSDVEAMSDGHDNMTAYGFDDIFDDPAMGWARYAHTIRIWFYDTGFFYIRPTVPSIELLGRVVDRLVKYPMAWEQAVFNEELGFPSHPGYGGLCASRRTMDFYLFLNSKVLFRTLRKDVMLNKFKPVVVRVNYHPDKLLRMLAIVDFYEGGNKTALDHFPDGSSF